MHMKNNTTKEQLTYCSNVNATTMNNINLQYQHDSNTDAYQSNNQYENDDNQIKNQQQ